MVFNRGPPETAEADGATHATRVSSQPPNQNEGLRRPKSHLRHLRPRPEKASSSRQPGWTGAGLSRSPEP